MRKFHRFFLLLVLIPIVGCISQMSFVLAAPNEHADANGNGIPDGVEKANKRTLVTDISNDSIALQSKLKSKPEKNQLDFEITNTLNSLLISTRYKSIAKANTFDLDFSMEITELIEYVDTNLDGSYTSTVDTTVQTIFLTNFTDFLFSSEVFTSDLELIIINTTAPAANFSIDIWIASGFSQISSGNLTPTQVKMDFRFDNFSFLSHQSVLALKMIFKGFPSMISSNSSEDEELGFASGEKSVKGDQIEHPGYFSWVENALVDGGNRSVNMSTTNVHGNQQELYLCYPRGENILHDPKIGIMGLVESGTEENAQNIWIDYLWLWILLGIAGIFGLLMTKTEYRQYLLNRLLPIESNIHQLSMEDVLENENRSKIIDLILDNKGIHYKELLRQSGISSSSLVWHLDILESFKVIRKQRVGQYIVYYPYLEKNPLSGFNLKLQKSKTALEILQLIGDNPGIYQNKIAKRMDMNHKTITYHLEKLLDAGFVTFQKEGLKRKFYPKNWPIIDTNPEVDADQQKKE